MMLHQSQIQERSHVLFPAFEGEQHYMVPFFKKWGLPKKLRHWQPTVEAMLRNVETDRPMFLMVDQREVRAGECHRRPGVHVDGYWRPGVKAHGGGHRGRHITHHDIHRGTHRHMGGNWDEVDFSEPELLLLASDVSACRAFVGEYDTAEIGEGGDASKIPTHSLAEVQMMDHRVYAGTVGTLHESLPLLRDAQRTVVRINCPGVTLQ